MDLQAVRDLIRQLIVALSVVQTALLAIQKLLEATANTRSKNE